MSRQVLNRGGWANGDVFLEQDANGLRVIKSYEDKPLPIRWIGRYLLARERRVYRRLAGLPGIPAMYPDPDRLRLALEYVEAERISNARLEQDGEAIIRDLRRLVGDMHASGVFHLDLRNQGNILVDARHRCYLLDFASSVIAPPGGLRSLLLAPLLTRIDRYGISKWAARAGQAPN